VARGDLADASDAGRGTAILACWPHASSRDASEGGADAVARTPRQGRAV